jgi:hypothetical protein
MVRLRIIVSLADRSTHISSGIVACRKHCAQPPDFSTLEKKKGAAEESLPRQEVETHS